MKKTSRGNIGGQHGANRTLVVGGVYGAVTLEHHIEEEENEMFANAAKLMSEDQLQELGKQMEEKKNSLKKAA
ncbi:hypothetical protein SAMN05216198_0622 [Halopseudomonas litoralis]|uniref:Uncharacterized protein n=1 Tax=Halopseudomonas litoralis TaxID=797277 RepID=A0A1H1MI06_9GAMM|nr:hypothetical protein SAMN05216198_0622 [Halopseudomonas litoralis]